jgi:60 kDa SS-A/Ro ribonucleoprotein
MANAQLFANVDPNLVRNEAGGLAYALEPKHALAQVAATGSFNQTFYSKAEDQLNEVVALADKIPDDEFIAKLAIYARERAFMKDMPAALTLILSKRNTELFHRVFDRVIDNGRMIRSFFQMLRSGRFGRKSLSYSLQRAVQRWLNTATDGQLMAASIGNDPSLRDVLRLARPTPKDNARRAFFGWVTEKPVEKWAPATKDDLPTNVKALEAFRNAESEAIQVRILEEAKLRWDLLATTAKGPAVWKQIARQMGAQALRMNLNTLQRHGVFDDAELVTSIADRIADAVEIAESKQFPYQFFVAAKNVEAEVPAVIKNALGRAAEFACGNVPALNEPVIIAVDVSGSMSSAVTGYRGRGATSAVRCIDVAALFAAAIKRRNPDSVIVPFDTEAYSFTMKNETTIVDLATKLATYGGGGTNCSVAVQHANRNWKKKAFAGVILLSDNESWVGAGRSGETALLTEWKKFVQNQQKVRGDKSFQPKLVCIDLQPYTTTQAKEDRNILNVGGFSDAVFNLVTNFFENDEARFLREIEAIHL